MAGNLRIVGQIHHDSGAKIVDLPLTNASGVGTVTPITITAGNTVIFPKPASAVGVIIKPAPGNTTELRLRDNTAADTGTSLHDTLPTLLALRAGVATFRLHAVGADWTGELSFF